MLRRTLITDLPMLELTPATKPAITFPLQLGEGPTWDDVRDCLWFVDITAPALLQLKPRSGAITRHAMPADIGSFGLTQGPRLIVALRNGVHFYDPARQTLEFLVHPEPDQPHGRLNDGKVGPDGAFYVGSMDERSPRQPVAALYRIAPDGGVTRLRDDLLISNGLAWSPDGRIMYHADTRADLVSQSAFDPANGPIGAFKPFCPLDAQTGVPDGATIDSQGYYWSAGVSAGCLNRIAPDGVIERRLHLPMKHPTMPCFGGPDLATLYVTSLSRDGDQGTLISLDAGVRGLPAYRFKRI